MAFLRIRSDNSLSDSSEDEVYHFSERYLIFWQGQKVVGGPIRPPDNENIEIFDDICAENKFRQTAYR